MYLIRTIFSWYESRDIRTLVPMVGINSLTTTYGWRRVALWEMQNAHTHSVLIDVIALQQCVMCPTCAAAVIMTSCVPAGEAALWLQRPQPGCSPDSPSPWGSSPVIRTQKIETFNSEWPSSVFIRKRRISMTRAVRVPSPLLPR